MDPDDSLVLETSAEDRAISDGFLAGDPPFGSLVPAKRLSRQGSDDLDRLLRISSSCSEDDGQGDSDFDLSSGKDDPNG